MCERHAYVCMLYVRMSVFLSWHWSFTGSLKILPWTSRWARLGEILLFWWTEKQKVKLNKWLLLLLDQPVFARVEPEVSVVGRRLGLCPSFYYMLTPSFRPLSCCRAGLSHTAVSCPWSLPFPLPQLLLEHQDAYQAGAVFPDAFYPSICERGKIKSCRPNGVSFTWLTGTGRTEEIEHLVFSTIIGQWLGSHDCVFHLTEPYLLKRRNSENFHDPMRPYFTTSWWKRWKGLGSVPAVLRVTCDLQRVLAVLRLFPRLWRNNNDSCLASSLDSCGRSRMLFCPVSCRSKAALLVTWTYGVYWGPSGQGRCTPAG